jgi:hypothetical protein
MAFPEAQGQLLLVGCGGGRAEVFQQSLHSLHKKNTHV